MKLFDPKTIKATPGTVKTHHYFDKFQPTPEEIELRRIEKELKEEAKMAFYK